MRTATETFESLDKKDNKCLIYYHFDSLVDDTAELGCNLILNTKEEELKSHQLDIEQNIYLHSKNKEIGNEHGILFDSFGDKKIIIERTINTELLMVNNKDGLPVFFGLQVTLDSIKEVCEIKTDGILKSTTNINIPLLREDISLYSRDENETLETKVSIFHEKQETEKKENTQELILCINSEHKKIKYTNPNDIVCVVNEKLLIQLDEDVQIELHSSINMRLKIINDNVLMKYVSIRTKLVRFIHIDNTEHKTNDAFDKLISETVPADIAIKTCETIYKDMDKNTFQQYFNKLFKTYSCTDMITLYKFALTLDEESLIISLFDYVIKHVDDLTIKQMIFWYTLDSQHNDVIENVECTSIIFSHKETFELNFPEERLPTEHVEYKYSFVHNIINHKNINKITRILLTTTITPMSHLKILLNSKLSCFPDEIEKMMLSLVNNDELVAQHSNGLFHHFFELQ